MVHFSSSVIYPYQVHLFCLNLVDQYGSLGNLVNYVTWFTSDARLLHRTGSLPGHGLLIATGSLFLIGILHIDGSLKYFGFMTF
jgi:hypothetical protein